ncbi:MAG: hypothetical protein HC781_01600 [Leptolyngbyaceae cyanobacterium CSU_1_4]|nr:hypothetical protein [Leptolyngbyaceae cyanobacterium CSU_1_4]
MQLRDYPDAIAQSKRTLLQAERTTQTAKSKLDEIISQFEAAIAFDSELKNDAQRKSRKADLMKSEAYLDIFEAYRVEAEKLEDLGVDHQLLLNRFSIAKLEAREAIATVEYNAACAA